MCQILAKLFCFFTSTTSTTIKCQEPLILLYMRHNHASRPWLEGIGLSITIVDKSIKAIEFIIGTINDAKTFGEHVLKLKTRLTSECARLYAFSTFLQQENETGIKRLNTLPLISQDAIVGMIQELELLFWGYSTYLENHNIEELQRGYTTSEGLAEDAKQLADRRKKERKGTQDRASWWQATKWGLVEKRKVGALVEQIEEWNERLWRLLLCGLCFSTEPSFTYQDHKALDELRLSTGLNLYTLVNEQNTGVQTPSLIKMDTTLVSEDSNSRIQTLVCRASDGKISRIRVLVEFKPYQLRRRSTVPPPIVVERVEKLAKLLAHAKAPDAGFRALLCIAVVPQAPQTRFAFAFELPESSFPLGNAPLDLQQAIKSKDGVRPTLGGRFAMATTVAQTIFELHSVHWLHKSVRSDNVIFGQQSVPTDRFRAIYRKPFIIGFEFSREQGDRSTTEQDDRLERNIYRDPDRQGAPADSPRFTVLHDIYSLGVVLLEIGLWRLAYEFEDFSNSDADSIRRSLQDHARDRLPHYMGEDYTNAVLSYLNGTLVAPKVAKKLTLPDHKQQLLEVNMALSEKIIDQIARGVKGT